MDFCARWSDYTLDRNIRILLNEKLSRRIANGYPHLTMQDHRREFARELTEWLEGFTRDNRDNNSSDSSNNFRERLIDLLATASKQNVRQIPLDFSDWSKLLNQWIKANGGSGNREIYKILAVDGFQGFEHKHLKSYLQGVLFPVREMYESHQRGVRKMYEYLDNSIELSGLNGTDCACIVFLALSKFFSETSKTIMSDDQVQIRVRRAILWAEGYLQQHAQYYRDIKNVDQRVYSNLGKIYADEADLSVGNELLKSLIDTSSIMNGFKIKKLEASKDDSPEDDSPYYSPKSPSMDT